MNFEEYIQIIGGGTSLNREQAKAFLGLMLDETSLDDGHIAEALTLLTQNMPTIEGICGFVDAMRARMTHVVAPTDSIDNCGTGGDKSGTFNISTAAAILIASAGVNVAKHGNRGATSNCGSPDVLEALSVPIDLEPKVAAKYLIDHHFVFLFAQLYHPALKRMAIVRKQLGFPTVFNLLGPLLNPSEVKRQVIGTFSVDNARLLAAVMAKMDHEHSIVLTSGDGLDEASLSAPVHVFEVRGEDITENLVQATDFGLEAAPISSLQGGNAKENAQMIIRALQPAKILSAHQRVIVFNAAFGFRVAGKTSSIADGVRLAKSVLASGNAYDKLKDLQTV